MEDDFSRREHSLLQDFRVREISCHALEEILYALVFFSRKIFLWFLKNERNNFLPWRLLKAILSISAIIVVQIHRIKIWNWFSVLRNELWLNFFVWIAISVVSYFVQRISKGEIQIVAGFWKISQLAIRIARIDFLRLETCFDFTFDNSRTHRSFELWRLKRKNQWRRKRTAASKHRACRIENEFSWFPNWLILILQHFSPFFQYCKLRQAATDILLFLSMNILRILQFWEEFLLPCLEEIFMCCVFFCYQ